MEPAWRRISSAASGSWENCLVAGEHTYIANLFLNNFIKMMNFL
jgi:hypothetical protein